MRDDYRAAYAELARQHPWWRARRRVVARELARLAPPAGDLRVLDVGCGPGADLDAWRAFGEVLGVEPDAELLPADPAAVPRIHRGPLSTLPDAAPFDRVLLLDVLEHLAHPGPLLEECRARLAGNGRLLVTVPAHPRLWSAHDELNEHRRRYTRAGLTAELRGAGFVVERVRSLFPTLAVARYLTSRISRAAPRPPSAPAEPWARLIELALRAEDRVASVLRPPFGASLLAVASTGPASAAAT